MVTEWRLELVVGFTNSEILSYGLHLFAGIQVILISLPVSLHSRHRLSQHLKPKNRSALVINSIKKPNMYSFR